MGWFKDVRDELRHHSSQNRKTNKLLEELLVATVAEQEAFDNFAAVVVSEATDISNAVAVVASEISKLRTALEAAGGTPLDSSKADAAIAALVGSTDSLQALQPVETEDPETEPEAPVEEPEVPVEPETPSIEDVPEGELVNENLR